MHEVTSVIFDVDQNTGNLAVAGEVYMHESPKGFIYYIDELSCSVMWIMFVDQFSHGV